MSQIDLDHFESIFIYNCFNSEEFLATVIDHTSATTFSDRDKAKVFDVLSEYFRKYNKKPNTTEIKTYLVTEDLRSAFKRVFTSLQQIENITNKTELYENTEQFLKEKNIFQTIKDYTIELQSGEVNTSAILAKIEKACSISLNTNFGLDLYRDSQKLIDDLITDNPVIPTKWKWLDDKLDGGLQKKGRALYIFAGQPNVGKSIVAGNLTSNIADQGYNVLLLTFEMSEMMYARRLASHITKIPIRNLKSECATLKHTLQECARNKKGSILIKEFPPSTITVIQVKAFIEKLRSSGVKIDVIVLDYLNLLYTKEGSNSYEKVKYIVEQVRAMTYVFSCPCVSFTQISRSNYNTTPEIAAISESSGTTATADFIAGIYQIEEDAENNNIRFGMMKNRFGPNFGSMIMNIDYSTLTITENEDAQISDYTDDAFDVLKALSN